MLDLVLAYPAARFGEDDLVARVQTLWPEVSVLVGVVLLGHGLVRGYLWGRWGLVALLALATLWRLFVADLPEDGRTLRVLLAAYWGLAAWSLAALPWIRPELDRRRRRRYHRLLGPLDSAADAARWLDIADAWHATGVLLPADRRYLSTTLGAWLDHQPVDAVPPQGGLRDRLAGFAAGSQPPQRTAAST